MSTALDEATITHLADLVADRVAARPAAPLLVDAQTAAAQLALPASWLLTQARANRVPHTRLGKYVRFNQDELARWAAERTRGPRGATGRPL
jgi:excisionase family DNA binding protein